MGSLLDSKFVTLRLHSFFDPIDIAYVLVAYNLIPGISPRM